MRARITVSYYENLSVFYDPGEIGLMARDELNDDNDDGVGGDAALLLEFLWGVRAGRKEGL